MTCEVIVADLAEGDLVAIVEYVLESDGVERALAVRDLLLKAVESLDRNPLRGRVVPALRREGISVFRELLAKRWRIVYRVADKQVHVVAILDGSRDADSLLRERAVRDTPG
jgi:plasmid stabilization system protein ParE